MGGDPWSSHTLAPCSPKWPADHPCPASHSGDNQICITSPDITSRFDQGHTTVTTNYPVRAWFLWVVEDRFVDLAASQKSISIRVEDVD